ncbi:transporter [Sphingomonas crusticola]|uniref:transporter n=1 Tax=Sphingomonas crusticola TaxID=1697973 RepID=UPI000E257D0D|nr:transporter [Sphingomonas crusticola]
MKALLAVAALLAGAPASAADQLRELCSERPGLDTPPCIVDQGHLQIEAGVGDWTLDKQPDTRTDTLLAGDVLARYGIGDTTELRLEWTAYGHVRIRDRISGSVSKSSGIGDVTLGLKQSVTHPDGDGFSVALLPYATLPTGRHQVGAGDWSAGLLIPVNYDLSDQLKLEITPEVDAAVDEDGNGRHTAYGSAAGLGVKLSEKWNMSVEAQVIRDRDPSGHSSQALGGVYVAYQPKDRLQFDAGAQAGLNHASPDVELYFGVTEKF